MMGNKQPAIFWYIGDWFKDPEVAMCETATRAIWFDALCRMHERKQGFVKGTIKQLSRSLRCTQPELKLAIEEIENLGIGGAVMNCNNIVTITSRRKTREFKELELNRLRVNRHRKKAKHTEKKQQCNDPSSYSTSNSITSSNTNKILEGYIERINKLFNRRQSTKWKPKEIAELKKVGEIEEDDFLLIEKFYAFDHPEGADFRRRKLSTFVNNLRDEIDKARNFKPPHKHGDQYRDDKPF